MVLPAQGQGLRIAPSDRRRQPPTACPCSRPQRTVSEQGFVRVINHSSRTGRSPPRCHRRRRRRPRPDHAGPSAPAKRSISTPAISNSATRRKGLSGSTGPGLGDWRLSLESDLDIEVLAYVRTADGFLTSMHDVVASDMTAFTGFPRSIRPATPIRLAACALSTTACRKRTSESAASTTAASVPTPSYGSPFAPGAARTLDAAQLESGTGDSDGLGDWQAGSGDSTSSPSNPSR